MLIALHQVIQTGGYQRVLVNPKAINYVENHAGTGSLVDTMIGTIIVKETPQEIRDKVSSATLNNNAQNKSNI